MNRVERVAPAGGWHFYAGMVRVIDEYAAGWALSLRTVPDQQLQAEREALEHEPPGPAREFVASLYQRDLERRRGQ